MKWLISLCCLFLVGCDHSTSLSTADGKQLTLSTADSRYVAVSYWAVWCTSCQSEVTAMNQLSKDYAKQLVVLGVNFDGEQGTKLQASIGKLNIHYPVVVSGLPVQWHLPMPDVLPTTYLLSAKHRIIKTFYGEKTAQELRAFLRKEATGDS